MSCSRHLGNAVHCEDCHAEAKNVPRFVCNCDRLTPTFPVYRSTPHVPGCPAYEAESRGTQLASLRVELAASKREWGALAERFTNQSADLELRTKERDEARARAEEAERYAEMVKAELLSEHAAGWQDRALDAERGRMEVADGLARAEEVLDEDAKKISALRTALEEAHSVLKRERGHAWDCPAISGPKRSEDPEKRAEVCDCNMGDWERALASISRALGSTAGEGVAKP